MKKEKYIRVLPLEGVYNVRDLGGYSTNDGRQTIWKKLFRGGDLNHLTETDLKYLEKLNLHTYIDFRSLREYEAAPDKIVSTLTEYAWIPVNAGDIGMLASLTPEKIPEIMPDAYRFMVRECQDKFREFFRLLAIAERSPLLFHCTAGKDRTGIAAALFLSAVGVNKETILEDYLLSAKYIKGKYDAILQKFPILAPLLTVKPEYLEAAFGVIDKEFGGMEHYLTQLLEVDIKRMKELYTE